MQVSAPLQALPSEQLVPAATAVCVTPVDGAHASVVHGFASSTTGGAPEVHDPVALHVSAPLHALPSLHDVPVATGVCMTPVDGAQASVVQGLPSSTTGGVPGVHVADALHVSAPLQALPSPQEVPAATGVCVTPVEGLQASVVQGLWSSTATWAPGVQVPAWQVSVWVQALPSVHEEPFDLAGFEQAPVDALQVPGSWHWSLATQTTGVPVVQRPAALQSSAPLQALLSEHEVPVATGVWLTPVAELHESVVHGLPSSTTGGVPKTQTAVALQVSAPLQALPSEQAVPAATGV